MTIDYIKRGEHILARQSLTQPAIYLDHWAIRHISTDKALRDRFVTALHAKGGTLAFSLMNLSEFASMEHEPGATAADALLDRVAPAIFFLRCEPFEVIARENAVAEGQLDELPAADDELMKGYLECPSDLDDALLAKKVLSLIVRTREKSELGASMESLKHGTIYAIKKLREHYESDRKVRAAALAAPTGAASQRKWSTFAMLQVLARRFLVDSSRDPSLNDAVDLLHTVVPSSYCDIVLLDGSWAAEVDKARLALSKNGIMTPVAQTFSGRRDGIERFFQALEGF